MCNIAFIVHQIIVVRGRESISKVEGHWAKGTLLYMTKIKRFYVVHEPNETFLKYGVPMTLEMAFTESLQKGTFFTFKKVGGGGTHAPIAPPVPRPLIVVCQSYLQANFFLNKRIGIQCVNGKFNKDWTRCS